MSLFGSYRLFNQLENGSLTGSQLNTLLGTTRYKDELKGLLIQPEFIERIFFGENAAKAVLESSVALNTIWSSPDLRAAFFSSEDAIQAFSGNPISKTIVFDSDTLVGYLALADLTLLRASATYEKVTTASVAGTTSRSIPVSAPSGTYIALGVSTSDSTTGATITLSTLRSGSTRPNTHVTVAASVSNTNALGAIAVSLSSPFAAISTDASSQTISVGMLRCDA